jgi:hypothetical protein
MFRVLSVVQQIMAELKGAASEEDKFFVRSKNSIQMNEAKW